MTHCDVAAVGLHPASAELAATMGTAAVAAGHSNAALGKAQNTPTVQGSQCNPQTVAVGSKHRCSHEHVLQQTVACDTCKGRGTQ